MIDVQEAKNRVENIRQEIALLGGEHVKLIAVTKTFPAAAMQIAIDSGCDAVAENYAQELAAKATEIPNNSEVHFIGALQTNKIKLIAPFVHCWQSVDRENVIVEIAKRSPGATILLQVNTTNEESKGGVAPREVDELRIKAESAGLIVQGLMTIGPTNGTAQECEDSFKRLRSLVDQHSLSVCSMGMSDDFAIAVQCGSTMIRIGRRILGERLVG